MGVILRLFVNRFENKGAGFARSSNVKLPEVIYLTV
jgi:hypothetical protein